MPLSLHLWNMFAQVAPSSTHHDLSAHIHAFVHTPYQLRTLAIWTYCLPPVASSLILLPTPLTSTPYTLHLAPVDAWLSFTMSQPCFIHMPHLDSHGLTLAISHLACVLSHTVSLQIPPGLCPSNHRAKCLCLHLTHVFHPGCVLSHTASLQVSPTLGPSSHTHTYMPSCPPSSPVPSQRWRHSCVCPLVHDPHPYLGHFPVIYAWPYSSTPFQTSFSSPLHDAPCCPPQLALALVLTSCTPALMLTQMDDFCVGHDDLAAFRGTKPQKTCLASCITSSTCIGETLPHPGET